MLYLHILHVYLHILHVILTNFARYKAPFVFLFFRVKYNEYGYIPDQKKDTEKPKIKRTSVCGSCNK